MKSIKKKFCPNCGSDNIKWTLPQNWSMWECFNCGYIGAVVLEDEEVAGEIRKEFKSKND